jgi:hypothetical protein
MFFEKLMPFWVKAPSEIIFSENSVLIDIFKSNAKKQRIKEMNQLVF